MALEVPVSIHGTPGPDAASVSWRPPATGDVPTGYLVKLLDVLEGNELIGTFPVDASQLSLRVADLVNGRPYFFTVAATRSGTTGPSAATTTITPTAVTVPDVPTNVRSTGGDKTAIIQWGKPASDGGSGVTGYIVKLHLHSDDSVVQTVNIDKTKFATTFTKLTNATAYYARVYATNAQGNSDYAQSPEVEPTAGAPAVFVTITGIGPDRIANTRPGESLADAPQMSVTGTNVDQAWGADADHALEWVLYTSTSHTTIVGTDTTSVDTSNVSATSFTISAPVAPGGADADSNHLIGPWRLKATYVPDPAAPTVTQVAYSPDFYTTQVGSIVIGTVTPDPLTDGDVVTITGPDVGVCTLAECTVGGNSVTVPVTRVDQNTATIVFPTFGLQLDAGGDITLQYELNGNVLQTTSFDINWQPASGGGGGTTYVPPTGASIPSGDVDYPVVVLRWVFLDPSSGETYTVPRNPDAMTSPFPQRTLTSKFTSALDGQALLLEGSPTLANWQFSGTVQDAAHYEALRHWCNDIGGRVTITDHYGRDIVCVLSQFAPVPVRNLVKGKYWDHTYQINATVVSVGEPTVVPA